MSVSKYSLNTAFIWIPFRVFPSGSFRFLPGPRFCDDVDVSLPVSLPVPSGSFREPQFCDDVDVTVVVADVV